jgi:YkoY family integral membrane protein
MSWTDIPTILTLAGLEIVLSADNAIVLAALAKSLPESQQKRALFYGIMGAFVLRFLAILSASWIIQFWFLQILGGGYLIWLGLKNLTGPGESPDNNALEAAQSARNFWGVVMAIELTDLAFAVDSVLAAVGVIPADQLDEKIWVVYFGAIIGLVAMRFAAVAVLGLLKKFPALIIYAYVLVSWIGIKLILQGCHTRGMGETLHLSVPVFWMVMGLIMLCGFIHWVRVRVVENGPVAD